MQNLNQTAHNPNSLTWHDFNRADLQPKPTRVQTAVVGLAAGFMVVTGAFALGAHFLKHNELAKYSAIGLFPTGLCLLFAWGKRCDRVSANQRNQDLIRRLDAGEFIPRHVHEDGTGGGS